MKNLGVPGAIFSLSLYSALGFTGATVPWSTYEAENMTTTGTIPGAQYSPNLVGSESSGRRYVQLGATGQFVQFAALGAANAIVVRYNVPDTTDGLGADYTLSLYTNGVFAQQLALTSKYSWLYGNYTFTNNPPPARQGTFMMKFGLSNFLSHQVILCACKRTRPIPLPITLLIWSTWKTSLTR